jgi:hypothetical protein
MGLIYLVVNTTEADNFDGKYDDPETVKQWRQRILPAVAAAVSDQQSRYEQFANGGGMVVASVTSDSENSRCLPIQPATRT